MSKIGKTEFVRTKESERNTQTIIDGKTVKINKGDEIKVNFFLLEGSDPVSGDIYVNGDLVGWMIIEDLREFLTELFEDAKSFES